MSGDIFIQRDAAYQQSLEEEQAAQVFESAKSEVMNTWERLVGDETRSLQLTAFRTAMQAELFFTPHEDEAGEFYDEYEADCKAFDQMTLVTDSGQTEVLVRCINLFSHDIAGLQRLARRCEPAEGVKSLIHTARSRSGSTAQKLMELDPTVIVSYYVPTDPTNPLAGMRNISGQRQDTPVCLATATVDSANYARRDFKTTLVEEENSQKLDKIKQSVSNKELQFFVDAFGNGIAGAEYNIRRRAASYQGIRHAMHTREPEDKDLVREALRESRNFIDLDVIYKKKVNNLEMTETVAEVVKQAEDQFTSYVDLKRYNAKADGLIHGQAVALTAFERLLLHGPVSD